MIFYIKTTITSTILPYHHPHTNMPPNVQRALYAPSTQKEDLRSDSQTKKKVPAINKMVFMKIARLALTPETIGKFKDTAKD